MNFETLKVLICDDSRLVRKNINQMLGSIGVGTVIEAVDGKDVVDKCTESKPDLVFMDIVMPKLTGVEALKAILAVNPEAKVVMLSSVGTQENLKQALDAGACNFIQKPVTDEKLRDFFEWYVNL